MIEARMRSDLGHWHQYNSNKITKTTNNIRAMAENALAALTAVVAPTKKREKYDKIKILGIQITSMKFP